MRRRGWDVSSPAFRPRFVHLALNLAGNALVHIGSTFRLPAGVGGSVAVYTAPPPFSSAALFNLGVREVFSPSP